MRTIVSVLLLALLCHADSTSVDTTPPVDTTSIDTATEYASGWVVGFDLGMGATTMSELDYYTDGTVFAGLSLGYVAEQVGITVGGYISGDVGVDVNHYFTGWTLYDEYYDDMGYYNYEWLHDDTWFEVTVNYTIPITIELYEVGLAVEMCWSRNSWTGKSFGLTFTRSWLWEL